MELNKSMRNFGCGALPSVKLLAEGKCAVYTVTARYVGFVEPWNGFWGIPCTSAWLLGLLFLVWP